jgi:DNA-binding GntR family transcriptional regulator
VLCARTAYDDLLAAGYLIGRVGAGTYVSPEVPPDKAAPPVVSHAMLPKKLNERA